MANMLYTEYLDKSITCGNKELEEIKLSYSAMKALLFRTYGRPDTVAELYLNNIRRVKPPASKTDVAGECRQAKEVYGHVVTLTTLEESEGVPVTTVMEHIYRNQFIKSLVAVLPKITRSKFMEKLEDEDLHVIAGKPYIRDIIALLKNEYRRLEVETEIDAAERVVKSVKAASAHQMTVDVPSSSESESSEEEPAMLLAPQSQNKKPKKKRKAAGQLVPSVNVTAAQQPAAPQPVVPQPAAGQVQQVAQHRPQQQRPSRPPQQSVAAGGNPATGLYVSRNGITMQFAPPVNQAPMAYGAPTAPNAGPRWACPVKGHSTAHEIGVCHEFWVAPDNKTRRDLIWETPVRCA